MPSAGTERSDRRAYVTLASLGCSQAIVKSKILCSTIVYVDLLCHITGMYMTTGHAQSQRIQAAHDVTACRAHSTVCTTVQFMYKLPFTYTESE